MDRVQRVVPSGKENVMAKKKSEKEELKEITEELKEVKQELKEEHTEEVAEFDEFEKELEDIKKTIQPKVIEKFTSKDIARAVVGTVLGMSTMIWAQEIWDIGVTMSTFNISIVFVLSLLIASAVLYFSQYRKVKVRRTVFKLLPVRLIFFYAIAFSIVFLTMLLFGINTIGVDPADVIIKRTILVSLPAVIAASAADVL